MTDSWDPKNPAHVRVQKQVEVRGFGLCFPLLYTQLADLSAPSTARQRYSRDAIYLSLQNGPPERR
jgi:hypothetical protein